MKMINTRVIGITFCSIVFALNMPFASADQPNLLVISEDGDRDAVSRDRRVFKRVLTAIQNQLVDEGFSVFDETLVTLTGFKQGRVRRKRQEILDIARSVSSPPIDVVVNFLIYASVNDTGYSGRLRIRIEGEILQVKSGRYLGNFEQVSPRNWRIKPSCARDRQCVLEQLGDKSRIIAADVGAVLAEKLRWMVTGGDTFDGPSLLETAYQLVFDGFTTEEAMHLEEYLVKFGGYDSHRITYSDNRRVEIWYEGTTTASRMTRNIRKMLEVLDLRANTQFSGRDIIVQKITLRTMKKLVSEDEW